MPITITDDDGVMWDVWEVKHERPAIANPVTGTAPSVDYTGPEGSLCLLSARGKKRLYRYPRFWSVLSDAALRRLCAMADAVPHSEIRAIEDRPPSELLLQGSDPPRPRLDRR